FFLEWYYKKLKAGKPGGAAYVNGKGVFNIIINFLGVFIAGGIKTTGGISGKPTAYDGFNNESELLIAFRYVNFGLKTAEHVHLAFRFRGKRLSIKQAIYNNSITFAIFYKFRINAWGAFRSFYNVNGKAVVVTTGEGALAKYQCGCFIKIGKLGNV